MANSVSDMISIGFALLLLAAVLIFCGWVIKRRFVDKRWPSSGTQFVSRMIYKQYETQEHREAVEEMDYTEEGEREEDRGGEGSKPGGDR